MSRRQAPGRHASDRHASDRHASDRHASGPLVVFGPRSLTYDFGPQHPLTPLRFGPGMDLLRAVGAEPGLAPQPAADELLLRVHLPSYLETVRAFSADPDRPGSMGIGGPDNPAFAGMHEAAASLAGGSVAAMEAILRGETDHAHHPGGGLHHAMPARASGFCVYNDPALAIVRARAEGLRVLYVDLDAHHGDGVQAAFDRDPGTLTLSIHESGRSLFPGTGFIDEHGEGRAAGSAVNLPLEPATGEVAWLAAVRALVPALAAVFGPDVIVSQHGADAHAWDPLAHLRVTTTAMGEAARVVDAVAHRWAGGRWLATGGGGYDVYRVVPRAWALTWLAGSHREFPDATPAAWRERWEPDAAAFGTPGMPAAFADAPNAGLRVNGAQETADRRAAELLERVRVTALPRLVREAEDRGWWRPGVAGTTVAGGADRGARTAAKAGAGAPHPRSDPVGTPVVGDLSPEMLDRLSLVGRTIPPFDPADGRAILAAALAGGARIVAAVVGDAIVGVAVAAQSLREARTESLLAVGVAPGWRRTGVGRVILATLVAGRPPGSGMEAQVGVAERDAVDPAPVGERMAAASGLLGGAGFVVRAGRPDVARDDRTAIEARLAPR